MSSVRIAAVAVAAVLLAACGSASGHAPSSPAGAAARPRPATSRAPAATPAATPASTGVLRLHAPKDVTLADNGAIVELSVGQAFTLRLPAPKGWRWRLGSFDTSVLARHPGAAGTLGVFHAVRAGFTLLNAEEVPPCGNACPYHAKGPMFGVAVRVAG